MSDSDTKETTRSEAIEKAIEMFREFDIDAGDKYAGLFLMYDRKEHRFRMIAVNASAAESMIMLDSAYEAVVESIEPPDENRTLN
jgi:hypothetical protein